MQAFEGSYRASGSKIMSALTCGVFVLGLALAAPAALASGGGGGGGGGEGAEPAALAEAAREAAAPGGGGAGAGGGGGFFRHSDVQQEESLTTCVPGEVRDTKNHKCLQRHSGVLPDWELTEYAYALAKADRFQEALDVLDMLDNPNTPRALNYRGYATPQARRAPTRGSATICKSVALDPAYPQVREYLGEAYVIEGKFDLAKEQLAVDREALRLDGLANIMPTSPRRSRRLTRCSVIEHVAL